MSESFLGWRRPAKAWLQLNRGEKGPRLRRPAVTCGPEFRLRQHRGKEVGSDGGVGVASGGGDGLEVASGGCEIIEGGAKEKIYKDYDGF